MSGLCCSKSPRSGGGEGGLFENLNTHFQNDVFDSLTRRTSLVKMMPLARLSPAHKVPTFRDFLTKIASASARNLRETENDLRLPKKPANWQK